MGRRVLITGLASFWGGLVAKALEEDDSVEVIVGLDTREPTIELERTEYVRSDENYSILSRTVQAPVWFSEETQRTNPPRNRIEQSIESVEGYVRDFAEDNPHVNVSLLRFSNVLGPDIVTPISRALELPVVPSILGFDPRFQFVHEDDVVRSILFVLDRHLPGIFNVAGDGLLPWSEVAHLCGKRTMPMPPIMTGLATWPLRQIGVPLPGELLDLLRYGRGIDNQRLKEAGFRYNYTSAGAVEAFIEAVRLRDTIGSTQPTYRYERDVEQFFRHSPAVVRDLPDPIRLARSSRAQPPPRCPSQRGVGP